MERGKFWIAFCFIYLDIDRYTYTHTELYKQWVLVCIMYVFMMQTSKEAGHRRAFSYKGENLQFRNKPLS